MEDGDEEDAGDIGEEEYKELEGPILRLVDDWGYRGTTREIFYKAMPGIGYGSLKKILADLEERGLIKMEWLDLDRFEAYITGPGIEHLKSLDSEEAEKVEAADADSETEFEKTVAQTKTKCNICMGSIKEGHDIIKCSCGNEYHATCGERSGKCPGCDVTFSGEE